MQTDVDTLLRTAAQGNTAAEELFALLYGELHRLAERTLRQSGGALTLGTTTLLHEAYLKIARRSELAIEDRARFFVYASRAMRTLVVDHARNRRALRRDVQLEVTLDDAFVLSKGGSVDSELIVRIGDALGALANIDPSLAELVDMHFFGGFSFVEIAELHHISDRTVQRNWRKARMLLRQLINAESS